MKVIAAAYSTKGVRPNNEDSFLLNTIIGGAEDEDSIEVFESSNFPLVFAVSDGMGGHAAGDVASQFVVTKIKDFLESGAIPDEDFFQTHLPEIHQNLLDKGKEEHTENMGATFVGISLLNDTAGFFNVGDSRIYRFRNDFLQQLSKDDSLCEYVEGAPKNIIINAMGAGLPDITVDTRFSSFIAVPDDIFLICSDGVHGAVSTDELSELLAQNKSVVEIARSIVARALENDSYDNATAVVIKLYKED